jgi:hypothetical protein
MLKRTIPLALLWSCMATASMADAVSDWNEKTVDFVTNRQLPPPQAERVMAMVQVAMFDAVNSIEPRYRPAIAQVPAPKAASKEAAAAAAAASVLTGLYPGAAELKEITTTYLAALTDNEAKSAGVRTGEAIAMRVLDARAKDGSDAADAYRPKTKPGVYVPTALTVGTSWVELKPFALKSASQFRPQPPIAMTSQQWASDYNEIKQLGSRTSTQRTARQTEDARFWLAPGPSIYYPVVRQVAAARKLDVIDNARFLALIAVARNDAFVAVFDAKYHYDLWRPITAIRNGDIDDNPNTERDPSWAPLDQTPMHPEYPCAHCIMSGTIASVVEALFGSADVAEVTLASPTAPGVTRRWTNLWTLADDVGDARVWAGFHYRFSTKVGQDMGRGIGKYVVGNSMQPAVLADTASSR